MTKIYSYIKSLLNEEWTKYLTKESLTLVNKSFVTSDYEETEADIVYKANINNKEVYFYILLEFQSTVDYRMPLRFKGNSTHISSLSKFQ
ncbi:MAG: hypothetical protein E7214_05875 [Clostridium sp.]|nr:hypothetical protein [Clostridium sp.]